MGEGHNSKQLRYAILALSEAGDWEVACREWSLVDISEADEPETCLWSNTTVSSPPSAVRCGAILSL